MEDRAQDFEFIQQCNSQAAEEIMRRFRDEIPGPSGGTESGRRAIAREIFEDECGGWSDFRRRAVIETIEQRMKNEVNIGNIGEII